MEWCWIFVLSNRVQKELHHKRVGNKSELSYRTSAAFLWILHIV